MRETAVQPIRRRFWVAALLGLAGGGLGFIYVGRPKIWLAMLAILTVIPYSVLHFFGGAPAGVYANGAIVAILVIIAVAGPCVLISRSRVIAPEKRPKLWHYFAAFALAVSLSIFFSEFVRPKLAYKLFSIPTASMAPNILPGDNVVAKQLQMQSQKASIESGTVVVFYNRKGGWEQLGRVVAHGGQTVRFSDGVIIVDGDRLPQERIGARDVIQADGAAESILHMRERLGVHSYDVLDAIPGGVGPLDNVGPYTVPEGHYFLVGDNRDRSHDSRVLGGVGYVAADDIIGEVRYIAFSVRDFSRSGKRFGD